MFNTFDVQAMIHLIHFRSMSFIPSPPPPKKKKIQRFRKFSGGIKKEHWLEMVQQLFYSKKASHNVSIFLKLYMPFPQPHPTQDSIDPENIHHVN